MNGNDDRSAAQIQDELKRTRGELDGTLSALERRLAPGQLMEDGLHYLRTNGATEYVANLGEAAKRDPIPLALVGVGLAWLMMSSRRVDGTASGSAGTVSSTVTSAGSSLEEAASAASDRVSQVVSSVGSKVADIKEKVSKTTQKVSNAVQSARDRSRQVGDSAGRAAGHVRGSYAYLRDEQPLALGAIGLAVGAALAAAAPRTRQEDQLMGETSDRLAEEAKATGREQLDKLKQAATAGEEAVASAVNGSKVDHPAGSQGLVGGADESPGNERAQ